MTETTSDNLQLLMMETGGREDDWGVQMNANLAKLEEAIAGMEALASTGGSQTLTDSEARNAFLNFTGSLASNRIVTVPNRTKVWVVRNGQTLGGYTLTMKTASGSAIEIPTGLHVVVCDGANALYRAGFSTITNTDLSTMAANTVKANITDTTANPSDVAFADFVAELPVASVTARVDDLAYSQLAAAAIATAANIWAKTASKLIDAEQAWEAAEYVELTSGTTIALNLGAGVNFKCTLAHDATLQNPTGAKEGQSGVIVFTQDGTGGRDVTFGSAYHSTGDLTVTVDTTAGRVTVVPYLVLPGGTTVWISANKGVR
jgi:hypothetical protein